MDVVALCSALPEIDSINPFQAHFDKDGSWKIEGNEGAVLDYCASYLEAGGFRTWRQPCGNGRENLLAERGEGDAALLLYGHADTVEVKPGWRRDEALAARRGTLEVDGREQEVLYGLGSNDMKGGLAVLLRAATTAQLKGYRLKVAIGCDEEFWSLGSCCLVYESDFLQDVAGVLVPEVGESTTDPAPGKWLVTLGRCGRTELDIDVPGTGGHGAAPEQPGRVNAVSQAARIALAIESWSRTLPEEIPFPGEPERIRPNALVTKLQGGEGLLSIPAQASLVVNRVLAPSESPESAEAAMVALLEQLRDDGTMAPVDRGSGPLWPTVATRPRPTPPLRPYPQSPEQPFVAAVLSLLGEKASYQLGVGTSVADENRFGAEAGLPVVVLGPRGERSHAAHEWVTVESLYQLEELYRHILEQLDLSTIPTQTKGTP